MRIDKQCELKVGTRDAVHMPFTVAKLDGEYWDAQPGDFVKFTNPECTIVEKCEERHSAHGIINPFLDYLYSEFIVFLVPGITTPVEHRFDIKKDEFDKETEILEQTLEERRVADPSCAECFQITAREVIRG